MSRPVTQDWVHALPMMQQTVLMTAIRGPDGVPKYGATKMLLRWYRRCVLYCALEHEVISDPKDKRGGSFTGPSLEGPSSHELPPWEDGMNEIVGSVLKEVDGLPHHFFLHLIHAAEIIGYKHPDKRISAWWASVYGRFVDSFHMHPESQDEMDARLGDIYDGWLARSDPATTA